MPGEHADGEGCMSTRGLIAGIATATVVVAGVVGVTSANATASPSDSELSLAVAAAPTVAVPPAPKTYPRAAYLVESERRIFSRQARPLSARQSFMHFAFKSPRTRDLRGIEKSLYRGRYFKPSVERERRCIMQRESGGRYWAVSPTGKYRGAYQVSPDLARGVTWMMLPEHKKIMGPRAAREAMAKLRKKPMNTWPRYWQDAAFHTVMNWEHTGSGGSHWAGTRVGC